MSVDVDDPGEPPSPDDIAEWDADEGDPQDVEFDATDWHEHDYPTGPLPSWLQGLAEDDELQSERIGASNQTDRVRGEYR